MGMQALILTLVASVAGSGALGGPARAAAVPAAPEAVTAAQAFGAIERAWASGDAESLLAWFGDRKVLFSPPGRPSRAQRFSRDQSYYILREHFEANEIHDFRFIEENYSDRASVVAVRLAQHAWRPHGRGRVSRVRVLVVLVRDQDRWVFSEIQSLQ